jgi:hypothetical protein
MKHLHINYLPAFRLRAFAAAIRAFAAAFEVLPA